MAVIEILKRYWRAVAEVRNESRRIGIVQLTPEIAKRMCDSTPVAHTIPLGLANLCTTTVETWNHPPMPKHRIDDGRYSG